MSAANQKLSFKDKITSHLPGHKNQDNNANGIPDRLEKNTMNQGSSFNQGGYTTAVPMASGAAFVPGLSQTTTTTSITKDVNGLPIQGNVLKDKTITSSTIAREPALVQTQGLPVQPIIQQRTVVTDFNRNGIPDQLEQQQGFGFVGSVAPNQSSIVDVREAPVVVERVEKAAVVHEVYKTEEVVQIQPIINREREQLDVYEVVQPMREREVIATEVRSVALPAQTRAVVVEDNSAFLAQRSLPTEMSTREVATTMHQTVTNAPIIHETITHRVIEEVQPVIYKEVDRPILIKETLPIYEKIVEAPHAHHTVLPMRDLGMRTVTTGTGFTDLNRDGIPDQLQGGMYQTTGLQSGLQSQGTFVSSQGGFSDLNRNGIPDSLERQGSFGRTGFVSNQTGFNDLNRNGIPDSLERQGSYGTSYPSSTFLPGQQGYVANQNTFLAGGSNDRNGNGIPDNLERNHRSLSDLNGNGIPDRMEKAHGLKDLNGNGIDDSLERRMGAASLNANNRV